MVGIAALAGLGLVLAAAATVETSELPEGCRDGVTLFCADPSWPTLPDAGTDEPAPARKLTARVGPAAPAGAAP